jgi:serine/threonine protein kinase/tetratricopeptide (TPR) repeat protein
VSSSPNNPSDFDRHQPDGATPAAASSAAHRILGDFELRGEIGRGGMGTVFAAWQRSLQRTVAVKVLNQAVSASQSAVVRFQREAQAAAKLRHPNIVPIFALGEEDGVYYYAMELIDGPGLNAVIAETRQRQVADTASAALAETVPLGQPSEEAASEPRAGAGGVEGPAATRPVAAASSATDSAVAAAGLPAVFSSAEHFEHVARHIASVADALDYAHAHGVIHRDIKPHNLIFSSDGKMLISDFGLARLSEQPGVTVTGELIGSPLYMSPEQVGGDATVIDHRTDICSLGATMYEWLTLKPPYPGETREQVISRILTSEPLPLRAHDPRIPIDLETICLKAIERDPHRRYRTAGEMRDDLLRYIASQPIRARRASLPTRVGKFVTRHQLATLGVLGVLIAAVLSWALFTSRQAVRTQTAAAEQEKEQTDKILGYLDALPLEISGPIRFAERAVPILTSEGADPSAAATPIGIASGSTLDFYEAAAAALRSALRANGSDTGADPVLTHAVELSRTDPETALGIVDAMLSGRPEMVEALELRAALCGRLGQFDRMLEDAEALVRLHLLKHCALSWRGLSYLLLDRPELGLADLNRAIELAGPTPWCLTLRGLLLIQANRVWDAQRDFDEALLLSPDLIPALLGRAFGRADVGDIDGATADLSHVLELDPENADVLALRGDRYVELANFEAAEQDYERAMEIGGQTTAMIMRYLSALTQRRKLMRGEEVEGVPATLPGAEAAGEAVEEAVRNGGSGAPRDPRSGPEPGAAQTGGGGNDAGADARSGRSLDRKAISGKRATSRLVSRLAWP